MEISSGVKAEQCSKGGDVVSPFSFERCLASNSRLFWMILWKNWNYCKCLIVYLEARIWKQKSREAQCIAKCKFFSGNLSRKLGLGAVVEAQSLNRDSRCTDYHTLVNILTFESLSVVGSETKCVERNRYQKIKL